LRGADRRRHALLLTSTNVYGVRLLCPFGAMAPARFPRLRTCDLAVFLLCSRRRSWTFGGFGNCLAERSAAAPRARLRVAGAGVSAAVTTAAAAVFARARGWRSWTRASMKIGVARALASPVRNRGAGSRGRRRFYAVADSDLRRIRSPRTPRVHKPAPEPGHQGGPAPAATPNLHRARVQAPPPRRVQHAAARTAAESQRQPREAAPWSGLRTALRAIPNHQTSRNGARGTAETPPQTTRSKTLVRSAGSIGAEKGQATGGRRDVVEVPAARCVGDGDQRRAKAPVQGIVLRLTRRTRATVASASTGIAASEC